MWSLGRVAASGSRDLGGLAAAALSARVVSRQFADCADPIPDQVGVKYLGGLPVVTVPLPSRKERCQFTLRPVSTTVADFTDQIKAEDPGLTTAALYDTDGERIAGATAIEDLVRRGSFRLRLNDEVFAAAFPPLVRPDDVLRETGLELSREGVLDLNAVKELVASMHAKLHIREHQLKSEKELMGRVEELEEELRPYEEHQTRIREKSAAMSEWTMWGGLAAMGVQWGAFARLTWWEYSWDIMEPITYFATYSTVILGYTYWILTRSPVEYGDMVDRVALKVFHTSAKKQKFDLDTYNKLKDELAKQQYELHRLRDPHRLRLPPKPTRVDKDDD